MKVFDSVEACITYRDSLNEATVGFVPTMGALHAGHQALLERSLLECDATILSIYVNPTQFNNPEDLAKYPETLDEDLKIAESLGVDAVFAPSYAECIRMTSVTL